MGNVLNFARTDPFSISYWVKITAPTTYYVFSKGVAAGPTGIFNYISATGISFSLTNANPGPYITVTVSVAIQDGEWHHVILAWDGDATPGAAGVSIYVDGTAPSINIVSDTLGSNSISNTGNFMLGGVPWGALPFIGSMNEVSVYDRKLTLAEANWIYNSGLPRDLTEVGAPPGLVAWWHMDAYSVVQDFGPSVVPNTIKDLSGNAYNGTMTNMETTDVVLDASGKGKSVMFGGTDEYVTMGNVLGFDYDEELSVSLWFKTATTASGYLVSKIVGDATLRGYGAAISSSGKLQFLMINDSGTSNLLVIETINTYNDDSWHHAVFTKGAGSSSTSFHIYVDGFSSAFSATTDNLSATTLNSASFNLGSRSNGSVLYIGSLDEVAIYSKELSSTEVWWVYNFGIPRSLSDSGAPPNLVGWWKMGDGDTHPTLQDSSTGGHNGTMTNMESTDITVDSPGAYFSTKSLLFDGVNEYITMGGVLGFEYTDSFSFSFWFKTTATGGMFVSKQLGSGTYRGYDIDLTAGRIRLVLDNDGVTGPNELQIYTSNTFNDGSWHHAVITYDGSASASGVTIWVDGVSQSLTTASNTLTGTIANAANFEIGRRSDGVWYAGNLTEVVAYNKELSSAEITWIYNNGLPRSPRDFGAPSNLVAWWKLGGGAYPGTLTNMESTDVVDDAPERTYYVMRAIDDNAGTTPPTYRMWVVANTPDYSVNEYYGPYSGGSINFSSVSVVETQESISGYYTMRAIDDNAGTTPPTYRTWTVTENPDYTAQYYDGPFSGASVNFSSVNIVKIS